MKKQITKAVLLVLVCVMLFSICGTAFADAGINNTIIGQPAGGTAGNAPTDWAEEAHQNGLNLIRATGDADKITLPNKDKYLESPVAMYVNADKKNSIVTYLVPWSNQSKIGPYGYHGARVYVIAEQDGYDCIIFRDHKNGFHTAWAHASELSGYYPGTEWTVGTPCFSTASYLSDAPIRWSQDRFVNSNQKYTICDGTLQNCVQFTLDYQVIGRNGAKTNEVVGNRTIYVNDGSGWIAVGQFPYPDIDSVHVVVNLEKPMNLVAVATIADCSQPDTFLFRQSLLDVAMIN